MSSGESNKRALFMGSVGGVPGTDWDIIELEEGAKPYKTGFPKQHFDMIVASRVLEKQPHNKVLACVSEWTRILKPGGELTIVVPNLRWAACAILGKEITEDWPAILVTLYGTQEEEGEFHTTGFTLSMIRGLIEQTGYRIKEATIFPRIFKYGDRQTELEYIIIKGEKG